MTLRLHSIVFFFFNDTATTEIYTLSLHDALPISRQGTWPATRNSTGKGQDGARSRTSACAGSASLSTTATTRRGARVRSEEHTSELQSRQYLVCRLLLEKKKKSVTSLRHWKLTTK